MSVSVIHSRALYGLAAPAVSVEVHLANGLPQFTLVGLPDTEVRESRDRVRAALQTVGFDFPTRRITVNLAPADLPKESARLDLPIAIGILVANRQIPEQDIANYEFVGELGLTGALRPVRGSLAASVAARDAGRTLILPLANADEAARVSGVRILAADHLLAVCAHLCGQSLLAPHRPSDTAPPIVYPDLADVKGQQSAKRALEIAAAGQHALLFIGPPGAGKSMLAQRLPGLLPPMDDHEALSAAVVQSLADPHWKVQQWQQRPYRAPHHTASRSALVGGGGEPRPGEISRAHLGVLFLDELPEFQRNTLESLREPLENGHVTIARASACVEFPAQFQLIAAMNPCPCGYAGQPANRCRCTAEQVRRYCARVSGPLLDRIDLSFTLLALLPEQLIQSPTGESSATVRERVIAAWARQQTRQKSSNARMSTPEVERYCPLNAAGQQLISQAAKQRLLSMRGYHRVLRVARTIADLADRSELLPADLAEALHYRRGL